MMNKLVQYLEIQAEMNPDHIAIIDEHDKKYSYADMVQWGALIKNQLQKAGISQKSKVVVAIPMSSQLYASLIGLFALGAVSVFLDPWLSGQKMNQVLKSVKPDLLLTTRKINLLSMLLPARYSIPKVLTPINFSAGTNTLNPLIVTETDAALITYTGGTSSGQPAGIVRTWCMLNAQFDALFSLISSRTPIVDFTHYPVFGLAYLAVGNTILLPNFNLMKLHKIDGYMLAKRFIKWNVERISCSPLLLSRLVEEGILLHAELPVKAIRCGGGRVSYRLVKKVMDTLQIEDAIAVYGSSEAEPIAESDFNALHNESYNPLDGVYAGMPNPAVSIRSICIFDEPISNGQWNDVLLKDEKEPGELIVSGAHVAKSYFYDDDDNFRKNKITDPTGNIWHRTGDIGTVKTDGIRLFGRKERVIKHQGKCYHPYPVEEYFERELNLTDTAYIMDDKNNICFCTGSSQASKEDNETIKMLFSQIDYPVHRLIHFKKNLPRDPRHRIKLLDKSLKDWL